MPRMKATLATTAVRPTPKCGPARGGGGGAGALLPSSRAAAVAPACNARTTRPMRMARDSGTERL